MKSVQFILVSLMVLVSATLCVAQELPKGEKATILIGRLQVQPSVKDMAAKVNGEAQLSSVTESLETQLVSALASTGVFQIVERKRKGDIELEQAFAAVAVNPNDKNAAKSLQMAGAKYAFLPQIDGFEDITEVEQYAAIGRHTQRRKIFLSAIVQIIDTTTGELLPHAPSIQLDKVVEAELLRSGTPMASQRAVIELAKDMAGKLAQKSVASLSPAKVLDITGKEVFINRGSEAGINKGDLVEIYAVKEIKDPDTGAIYKNEVPMGQALVSRVALGSSYATMTGDNLGVVNGCVVRVIKAAELPIDSAASDAKPLTPGSSEKPLKWN
jgi:hypothetical protein